MSLFVFRSTIEEGGISKQECKWKKEKEIEKPLDSGCDCSSKTGRVSKRYVRVEEEEDLEEPAHRRSESSSPQKISRQKIQSSTTDAELDVPHKDKKGKGQCQRKQKVESREKRSVSEEESPCRKKRPILLHEDAEEQKEFSAKSTNTKSKRSLLDETDENEDQGQGYYQEMNEEDEEEQM